MSNDNIHIQAAWTPGQEGVVAMLGNMSTTARNRKDAGEQLARAVAARIIGEQRLLVGCNDGTLLIGTTDGGMNGGGHYTVVRGGADVGNVVTDRDVLGQLRDHARICCGGIAYEVKL